MRPRHRRFKVPIGPAADPLMWRWQILRIGSLPRIFVHKFLRSDYDRALHNHPWWFISILLKGEYLEHTEDGVIHRKAPSIVYRPITHRHRIEINRPAWTLFITGPDVRRWGFFCPEGFVDSADFQGCEA